MLPENVRPTVLKYIEEARRDRNFMKWFDQLAKAVGPELLLANITEWRDLKPQDPKLYTHIKNSFEEAIKASKPWQEMLAAIEKAKSEDIPKTLAPEPVQASDADLEPWRDERPSVIRWFDPDPFAERGKNLDWLDPRDDPDRSFIIIRMAETGGKGKDEEFVADDPEFAPAISVKMAMKVGRDEPDWDAEEQARIAAANREDESSLVTKESVTNYFTRLDEVKEREEANSIIYIDGKAYRKTEYERMMAEKGEHVSKASSHDFDGSEESEDRRRREELSQIQSNNEEELKKILEQDPDSLLDAMFAQKTGKAQNLSDNPDDEPSLWDRPRSPESEAAVPTPSGEMEPVERRPVDYSGFSNNPDDERSLMDNEPAETAAPMENERRPVDYSGLSDNPDYDRSLMDDEPVAVPKEPENAGNHVFGTPEKKTDYVFGIPEGYSEDEPAEDASANPDAEMTPETTEVFDEGGPAENFPEEPDGEDEMVPESAEAFDEDEPAPEEPPAGASGEDEAMVAESFEDFDEDETVAEDAPTETAEAFDEDEPAPEDGFDEDIPAGDDGFDEEPASAETAANAAPADSEDEIPHDDVPETDDGNPQIGTDGDIPISADDPFDADIADDPFEARDAAPGSPPAVDDDPFESQEGEGIPEAGDDPFAGNDAFDMPGTEPAAGVPASEGGLEDEFERRKAEILAETMRNNPIGQPEPEPEPAPEPAAPPVREERKKSFIRIVPQEAPEKKPAKANPLAARFGKATVKVVQSDWD